MAEESTDQPPVQSETLTKADLEAFIAEMNKANDKRFQGFQSLLDRRDETFSKQIADLKDSSLEPEEREQVREQRLAQEVEELRRRNEILSMRKTHPEEADLIEQFLSAGTLEDQIVLLSQFRKAEAPATPDPEEGEADEGGKPTPVDKNNPARTSGPSLENAAAGMNKQLADQLMNTSGGDKGILARLRRQG